MPTPRTPRNPRERKVARRLTGLLRQIQQYALWYNGAGYTQGYRTKGHDTKSLTQQEAQALWDKEQRQWHAAAECQARLRRTLQRYLKECP